MTINDPTSSSDEPVRYRVCNVDETGHAQPLPDDPRFHQAMDQVARAAARLHHAEREREFQERLAAWLAGQQHTIAAALAALPAGMAAQTQAVNVHAALLAAAGMPDADVRTEWAVQYPDEEPLGPSIEVVARRCVAHARSDLNERYHDTKLLSRTVITGAWQPVDGAR